MVSYPFVFFLKAWGGQYKAIHKVQHLLVTWGQIEKFLFSISALTPSVKSKGIGGDFNFCTNKEECWIWVEHWP
jgi:hypothetical protein